MLNERDQKLLDRLERERARRTSQGEAYGLGFADCIHVVRQWLTGPDREVRLIQPLDADGNVIPLGIDRDDGRDVTPIARVASQEPLYGSKIVREPEQ